MKQQRYFLLPIIEAIMLVYKNNPVENFLLGWLVTQRSAGYQPVPAWVISCAGCAVRAIGLH